MEKESHVISPNDLELRVQALEERLDVIIKSLESVALYAHSHGGMPLGMIKGEYHRPSIRDEYHGSSILAMLREMDGGKDG